jgi:hypothetical protein
VKQYRPMNIWQEERAVFMQDRFKDARRRYIKRWRQEHRLRLVRNRQSCE